MRTHVPSIRAQAQEQADELARAIDSAETVIISTIERECEALRAGRMLAANALRQRLRDAARLYLGVMRAAQASMWTMDRILPGTCEMLEDRRRSFSAMLKVELSVLAAERAAAESELELASAPRQQRQVRPLPPVRIRPRRKTRLRRAG